MQGGQEGTNAPGGAPIESERRREALTITTRPGEKIIHSKVVRFIAAHYGLNVWGTEYLAALESYLLIMQRQGIGVPEEAFIEWTGARGNWQKQMNRGGRECKEAGAVERFHFSVGHCIDLTEKGRFILKEYGRRFEEIKEELRIKAAGNSIKEAGRRSVMEHRRRLGKAKQIHTEQDEKTGKVEG